MASYIHVFISVYFLFNFVNCVLNSRNGIKDESEIEINVPHNASVGYIVMKLGCSENQINIQTHGGNEFYESFILSNSGILVVKSDLSHRIGKSYTFTVKNTDSCHSNIPSQITYILNIKHSNHIFHFSQRFFTGFLPKESHPGTIVKGIFSQNKHQKETKAKYSLIGPFSNQFAVNPISNKDLQDFEIKVILPLKSKFHVYYFTLIGSVGQNVIGHTNIEIIMIDHYQYDNLYKEAPQLSEPRNRFVLPSDLPEYGLQAQNSLAVVFYQNKFGHPNIGVNSYPSDEIVFNRFKRQTSTTESIAVPEDRTGVLFSVPGAVSGSNIFEIISPEDTIFQIDNLGAVRLKPGSKLDYDADPNLRSHVIAVKVSSQDGNTVVNRVITVIVTEVNDEVPVITNRPKPMLATVSATVEPNVVVYTLTATDIDEGSSVRYYLDGTNEQFRVDETTGQIITRSNLLVNVNYNLNVYARDINAAVDQRSAVEVVSIYTGNREPQFYYSHYYGSALENTRTDTSHRTFDLKGSDNSSVQQIQVVNFQNGQTIFRILQTPVEVESTRLEITSDGRVVSKVSTWDFESAQKQFNFVIEARDSETQLQSKANLTINILDVNEFAPVFLKSTYKTTVQEDIAVGTTVNTVQASDGDDGQTLTYTVSDDHFRTESVGSTGYIIVNKKLDYDRSQTHRYTFTVTATDSGTVAKSGTANVNIQISNVNDEYPIFDNDTSKTVTIREDKPVDETVIIVKAVDSYENDRVTHTFQDGTFLNGIFRIDGPSGKITLRTSPIAPDTPDTYELRILATDDGSCCGGTERLTSTTTVTINIVDAINTKPVFTECNANNLIASVREEQAVGTPVIKVNATDSNRGENGVVEFFIKTDQTQATSSNFTINMTTGLISTKVKIDRESLNPTYAYVTILAQDRGQPPANSYCTLKIDILDINDNAPLFGASVYDAFFEDTAPKNTEVYTIRATDKDAGPDNNDIEYSLTENDGSYFKIDPNTGVISVAAVSVADAPSQVLLRVMAQDKGTPRLNSTTQVRLTKQTDSTLSPTWIGENTFSVKETVAQQSVIATLKANSNYEDSAINYKLLNSSNLPVSSVPPFRISQNSPTTVNIIVQGLLDYETKKSYELVLKATNRQDKYKLQNVIINVNDTNDEIPRLTGVEPNSWISAIVQENSPSGEQVRQMLAVDRDENSPFNLVRYYIPNVNSPFEIDEITGIMRTNATFDRETKKFYYVQVLVKDGAPSAFNDQPNNSTETVRVEIGDENDNSPYFERDFYEATAPEDKPLYDAVIAVQAEDLDDTATFSYTLEENGAVHSGPFSIKTSTGIIIVSNRLDYETEPNVYNLTVRVSDGKNQNSTKVRITVTDVNDETPVFKDDTYEILNISEATMYSPSSRGFLVTVEATDGDIHRTEPLEYQLDRNSDNTDFIDKFYINENTGQLYVQGQLDRDQPNGREVYQFDVKAIDDGKASTTRLTGYATVKVLPIDVNDNDPQFRPETLTGYVEENKPADTSVMTIVAFDNDAGDNAKITYSIGQQFPSAAFKINPSTGDVSTTIANIDREQISNFTFEVIATDGGEITRSTSATATVLIKDVNDNPVTISPVLYSITIPETHTKVIMTFEATDPDVDDTLYYQIIGPGTDKFSMVSRGRIGELSVFNRLDYENKDQNFNLTVEVNDGIEAHKATFYVELTILDVNDEVPEFTPKTLDISIREDINTGYSVANFTATDRDAGVNGQIEYFISRKTDSDPDKHFAIGINNGQVTLIKALDRETTPIYTLKLLAIDKGVDIRNTGTATLTVTVIDVNDEFPRFKEDYRPVINENSDPTSSFLKIYAIDRDSPQYGPPFGFFLVCEGSNICDSFRLNVNETDDSKKGTATIGSLKRFDREEQEYYFLPIRMWDMRDKPDKGQTGTNTLTVTIGNLDDNNISAGGKQNIFVYNYKGMFKNIVIGRVNYVDEDGWDIDNGLTFTMVQKEPASSYFSVDSNNGDVKMLAHVPSKKHDAFQVQIRETRSGKTVVSEVTVTVMDLAEEAPYFSGSMQLSGTTPELFVTPQIKDSEGVLQSPYNLFRQKLAGYLKYEMIDNVQIISILKNTEGGIDVRYAAHGSPYLQASQLDGIVRKNKNAFQSDLGPGAEITTVAIDECLKEVCEGGCYNEIQVTGQPNVVNAPGASVVGVETLLLGKCGCRLRANTTKCTPDYCYNNGTCEEDYWGVLSCKCIPGNGFDGPRCQQTRHGFNGTNGAYALYKTLEQCENSVTSIEIITNKPHGIIYYNGPVDEITETDPTDFILLQLKNGNPTLMINHGSGTLNLTVNTVLSDGKWHRIDVMRNGKEVTMTIDFCKNAPSVEGVPQNRSTCEARGFTPGENIYVNVNTPLQMGGRYSTPSYPSSITTNTFNGCVRNFRHNNEIYNLFTNGLFKGNEDGCPEEDDVCRKNSVDGRRCEPNGDCRLTEIINVQPPQYGYECICDPGYRGDNCETNTTVRNFTTNAGYIEWNLVQALDSESKRKLEIQMSFRSRDQEGLLYHVSSTTDTEFIRIQIKDYILELLYNLGDGEHNLTMFGVNASDGQWHTAKIERHDKVFIMMMDGGEGLHIVQTQGPTFGHRELTVKNDQLYAGGSLKFSHNTVEVEGNALTESCFNDIRLQKTIWFPVTNMESDSNTKVKIKNQDNLGTNCIRNDCEGASCTHPFVCRPLWGFYECVCKTHHVKSGITCVPKDYCAESPCLNAISCKNDPLTILGFVCECKDDWEGDLCNSYNQKREADDVAVAYILLGILIPLLLIILIVGIVYWLWRRKPDEGLIPDDEKEDYDIRENVVAYDEDGAGEEDNDAYDINRLRKPVGAGDMAYADRPTYGVENEKPLGSAYPPKSAGIGDFIDDRLGNADDDPNAPPYDTLRDFDYEGGGSDAGSLSSLNTSSSGGDQDYDYLNEWGPKFRKLADMYNQYDDVE